MDGTPDEKGWTPIQSDDGQFYCSPRCGGGKFCRREWHDMAVKKADELAVRLGDGWTPRVWENLGWFYSAEKGRCAVHPSENRNARFDPATGYPVSSYTAYFNARGKQFIATAEDPNDAVGFATQDARTHIVAVTADLAELIGDAFAFADGD